MWLVGPVLDLDERGEDSYSWASVLNTESPNGSNSSFTRVKMKSFAEKLPTRKTHLSKLLPMSTNSCSHV